MTTPAPRAEGGGRDQRDAATTTADRDATRAASQSVPAELRRRRAAAWRCEPLADGLCDPLDPCDEPVSDGELDSWRAAWSHLDRVGLVAIIPERVLAAAGHAQRWDTA